MALVAQADAENMGICFDMFHYYTGPSKFEDLAYLAPANLAWIQVCDLAGVPRELAGDGDRILPGDGDFQLGPILDQLAAIGYNGYVSLEVLNPQLWQVPADRVAELNDRLDNPPVADESVSKHMGLFVVAHLAERHGVRVRLRPGKQHGLTALVWIPEQHITRQWAGGWQRVAGTAEQSQVYEAGAEWFGHGNRAPAYSAVPVADSPADAGWRAAATAAAPAYEGFTTAGLPQRTPRANLVPGTAGEPPTSASGAPARSADRARARLGAFQRASLRVGRGQAG